MSPTWTTNWIWGLLLVALTFVIHAVGIVIIGLMLGRAEAAMRMREWGLSGTLVAAALLIGSAGWMLAVLHGLEAMFWAEAYLLLGAVGSLGDAMLYSVDSMTTRGASGLTLQHHWRMMGALEAANGALLFGMSTAFLFAILQRVWQRLQSVDNDPHT
jgi:hypothetical protein